MAYLSTNELGALGFKSLGKNVKISDKASIYDADKISIGDNSRIDDFCVISGKVTIGKFVHIAPLCLLAGGEMGIILNDFSGCAYGVKVFTQSDNYSGKTLTNATIPAKYKKEFKREVTLGKHVIIGTNSIVFPNVNIADGCSIGAMSLVHKSTKPWGIYVGNPAQRIKDRKQDLLEFEKEFLEEYSNDSI